MGKTLGGVVWWGSGREEKGAGGGCVGNWELLLENITKLFKAFLKEKKRNSRLFFTGYI